MPFRKTPFFCIIGLFLIMCFSQLLFTAELRVCGTGFARNRPGFPPLATLMQAREAAVIDAQRALLEFLQGTLIQANTTVQNKVLLHEEVKRQTQGLLQNALIVGDGRIDANSWAVVMAVDVPFASINQDHVSLDNCLDSFYRVSPAAMQAEQLIEMEKAEVSRLTEELARLEAENATKNQDLQVVAKELEQSRQENVRVSRLLEVKNELLTREVRLQENEIKKVQSEKEMHEKTAQLKELLIKSRERKQRLLDNRSMQEADKEAEL